MLPVPSRGVWSHPQSFLLPAVSRRFVTKRSEYFAMRWIILRIRKFPKQRLKHQPNSEETKVRIYGTYNRSSEEMFSEICRTCSLWKSDLGPMFEKTCVSGHDLINQSITQINSMAQLEMARFTWPPCEYARVALKGCDTEPGFGMHPKLSFFVARSSSASNGQWKRHFHTHTIHVWHIYLHVPFGGFLWYT